MKILVALGSKTKFTEAIAEFIHAEASGKNGALVMTDEGVRLDCRRSTNTIDSLFYIANLELECAPRRMRKRMAEYVGYESA